MLEVVNLTKTYKGKGGNNVKALNGISVSFPETGMVFLLGKSGSGKSTLLNVVGGLDSPTSGEIIVKGRSSKNFSQKDFDSYRNTFIGFIFQEYNILNEFSVEDNIGLALELQGKSKDKEAINALLTSVDLEGYAKRKPNTLSGGQKQRIAIARALIKEPEIIMADEPTGALDSTTGRQVLETLKKLSKDKLVIVVSHDREFAENYGDRIIELKDGKIISDVTKTHEQKAVVTNNVDLIGNVLSIKNASNLNENDFSQIKQYLMSASGEIILAKDADDIKTFKLANRINVNGEMEVFKGTTSEDIKLRTYTKEESQFIKSKLPLRHAIKIGLSSLKNKPIRLLATIGLCTVAFVLFGILSTMAFYDSESTFKQTLRDNEPDFIKISKIYKVVETQYTNGEEDWSYDSVYDAKFTKEEVEEYVKKYGEDTFAASDVDLSFTVASKSEYYLNQILGLGCLDENNTLRKKINGEYPVKDNEIVISSYTADAIYNNKVYQPNKNKILELNTPQEIIGKQIMINGKVFKVTGIIDSGALDSKYEELKNSEMEDYRLRSEFLQDLSDGIHLVAFVTENTLVEIADEYDYYYDPTFEKHSMVIGRKEDGKYKYEEYPNVSYAGVSYLKPTHEVKYIVSGKEELGNKDVIITEYYFYTLVGEYYRNIINNSYDYNETLWKKADLAGELQSNGVYKENEFIEFTAEQKDKKLKTLLNYIKQDKVKLNINVKLFDEMNNIGTGDAYTYNVVGFWIDKREQYSNKILLNDKVASDLWNIQKQTVSYYSVGETKYVDKGGVYKTIYVPFKNTEENINSFWDIYKNEYGNDDSKVMLSSGIVITLQFIDEVVETLSKVLIYVAVALAVFAALLFSNFISVSISYKKKEIGILRAVGARSFDVFKIFFSESFFITLICVILAVIGNLMICNILNSELASTIGMSVFVFGIASLVVLTLLAFITSVVATFLPVYNAARKKPVDSIRSI